MADIDKIIIPDRTEYSLKDSTARSDISTLKETVANNAYESQIKWGNTNIAGDVTPVSAAIMPIIGGNKLAFANPDGITFERSLDDGETWTEVSLYDSYKIQFMTPETGLRVVRLNTSSTYNKSAQLRVTLDMDTLNVHTLCKKLLLYVSTGASPSNFYVKIEHTRYSTGETLVDDGSYQLLGYSGWNDIPYITLIGHFANQTSSTNVSKIRLTFWSEHDTASSSPYISNIALIGTVNYLSASTFARTGHLYGMDASQNATFPANVIASNVPSDNLTRLTALETEAAATTLAGHNIADAYTKDETDTALSGKQDALSVSTLLNTVVSGFRIRVKKYGAAVLVQVQGRATAEISSGSTILSGLPATINSAEASLIDYTNAYYIYVNTSGNLYTNFTIPSGKALACSFVYFTNS